jgi:hypothetical protein
MQTNITAFTTWSDVKLSDIDNSSGQKVPQDINSSLRTTDGYVRGLTLQNTVEYGDTVLLDYAISWSYLSNYTSLRKDQTWRMALADFRNATDHNTINSSGADLAGTSGLSGPTSQYWSYEFMVPEPSANMLLAVAGGFSILSMVLMRRRRK